MSTSRSALPRFALGRVVVTPRAEEALRAWGESLPDLLARHQSGDWGEASELQRSCNEEALARNYNLVSHYRAPSGATIIVTTRGDRSCTMVHLGLSDE